MCQEDNKIFKLSKGNTKPFLTLDQQLDLLEERGLKISDRKNALNILSRMNYYRLSGYSLSLRSEDKFHPGVSFDNLYELYRFDDTMRKIVFQYAQYVEIAFRSYISYEHANKYGAQGYMDHKNFTNIFYHLDFIAKLEAEIKKSDDLFVEHHKKKCNCVFPFWVAIECSTFGNLSKLYKNLLAEDRALISKKYIGVPRVYVENWLQATVYARNIAAHGGRFYNRYLRTTPIKLDKQHSQLFDNRSVFAHLYAIYKMLPTKALSIRFREDLDNAISKYPFANIKYLGFTENWMDILLNAENPKAYDPN